MRAPGYQRIAGCTLIAATLMAAVSTAPLHWKIWLPVPLYLGLGLVLRAHASRRGGWGQVSVLASATVGLMAMGAIVMAGLIWLGVTTGFAE